MKKYTRKELEEMDIKKLKYLMCLGYKQEDYLLIAEVYGERRYA